MLWVMNSSESWPTFPDVQRSADTLFSKLTHKLSPGTLACDRHTGDNASTLIRTSLIAKRIHCSSICKVVS